MKTNYREFQFTLLALAPIHIGSGEKYTSREYIYENGHFYFPDMSKFYNRMVEKGYAQNFEQFLQKKSENSNNHLISFLNDNRICNRDFGGYCIRETGLETEKNDYDIDIKAGEINGVAKFIRDPFGKPYIPGSSLKGAIRTILMNTNPAWNNNDAIDETGGFEKENTRLIPWGSDRGKKFDDLFNEIRVSDSKPLRNSSLILVQKWDYSAKSSTVKPLPVYRESLAPLTHISFTITTTSDRAGGFIEELGTRAQEFYNAYKEFFLVDFPEEMIQNNIYYPIYLGAGSGAWTKTLFKQACGILQKQYCFKSLKMEGKGVLKLTKATIIDKIQVEFSNELIKNKEFLYEMGKANFIIKEITN